MHACFVYKWKEASEVAEVNPGIDVYFYDFTQREGADILASIGWNRRVMAFLFEPDSAVRILRCFFGQLNAVSYYFLPQFRQMRIAAAIRCEYDIDSGMGYYIHQIRDFRMCCENMYVSSNVAAILTPNTDMSMFYNGPANFSRFSSEIKTIKFPASKYYLSESVSGAGSLPLSGSIPEVRRLPSFRDIETVTSSCEGLGFSGITLKIDPEISLYLIIITGISSFGTVRRFYDDSECGTLIAKYGEYDLNIISTTFQFAGHLVIPFGRFPFAHTPYMTETVEIAGIKFLHDTKCEIFYMTNKHKK